MKNDLAFTDSDFIFGHCGDMNSQVVVQFEEGINLSIFF
jgi:hypothetical protein